MKMQTKFFLTIMFFCLTFLLLGSSPVMAARCPRCHRYVRNAYQCPYCNNSNYNYNTASYDDYDSNSNSSYNNKNNHSKAAAAYGFSRLSKSKHGPVAILVILAIIVFHDYPILGIILGILAVIGFIGNCCDKSPGN